MEKQSYSCGPLSSTPPMSRATPNGRLYDKYSGTDTIFDHYRTDFRITHFVGNESRCQRILDVTFLEVITAHVKDLLQLMSFSRKKIQGWKNFKQKHTFEGHEIKRAHGFLMFSGVQRVHCKRMG